MRTTDAAVARRCLGRVFARHRLAVAGGSLDFTHQQVSLGETSTSLVRYGADVEIVAPPLDFYLLQVTLGGRIRLKGPGFDLALEAGSVFVMNPGVGYRKCWDREAQQLMLKIPRRRLEWLAPGMASAGGAQIIEFAPTVLPAAPLAAPLRQLLDQLDTMHKFAPPPTLVEDEFTNVWNAIENDLKQQGRTFADEGTTEEKAREEYRAIAERRVRLGLVLAEIGEKNNIKVADDELSRAIVERARQVPGREQEVWDYYRKNPQALASVRAPLFEEKVVDFLVELAKVTDKQVSREELYKEDEDGAATT